MNSTLVAYYRVGDRHDVNEQAKCVRDHARRCGAKVVRSFRETESGKRPERPQLARALDFATRARAGLVVATIKGLARDRVFLTLLKESGVDFVACDLPHANSRTVDVLTALAEYEARLHSERTRRALAQYKAAGGKLGAARPGGSNLTAEARRRGARAAGRVVSALADEAYRQLAPLVAALRAEGHTLQDIADRLNEERYTTRRGRPWNSMQVSRVLKRFDAEGRAARGVSQRA